MLCAILVNSASSFSAMPLLHCFLRDHAVIIKITLKALYIIVSWNKDSFPFHSLVCSWFFFVGFVTLVWEMLLLSKLNLIDCKCGKRGRDSSRDNSLYQRRVGYLKASYIIVSWKKDSFLFHGLVCSWLYFCRFRTLVCEMLLLSKLNLTDCKCGKRGRDSSRDNSLYQQNYVRNEVLNHW